MNGERYILVLDEPPQVDDALCTAMDGRGYTLLRAEGVPAVLRTLRTMRPDLVLLAGPPQKASGLAALQTIRAQSAVPMLMFGGARNEDAAVAALQLGADVFVAAPCSARELLARIESVLRRAAQPASVPADALVVDADLTIDFGRNRVCVRGQEVALTAHEYRLLYHLVSNAGRLMPYDALLARVWGPEYQGDAHYVRLYVSYLRAKIEPDPSHPKYILTEKGLGYRFTEREARAQRSGWDGYD